MALSKKGDWIELVKWRADVVTALPNSFPVPFFRIFFLFRNSLATPESSWRNRT
jgi:hypothetical protein